MWKRAVSSLGARYLLPGLILGAKPGATIERWQRKGVANTPHRPVNFSAPESSGQPASGLHSGEQSGMGELPQTSCLVPARPGWGVGRAARRMLTNYSQRSAITGSIRVARRAGITDATSAINPMMTTTKNIDQPSAGFKPKSSDCR